MKNSNYNQVVSLNKMWNTLDPSYIINVVDENIHYTSFWVLRPIDGRERFLDYIERKLKTIKEAVDRGDIKIQSFVGQAEGNTYEYFIILQHTIRGKNWESLIRVIVDKGLIVKMSIEPMKRRFNIKPLEASDDIYDISNNN